MKTSKTSIGLSSRSNPGHRARRTWMPVTDSWVGSSDDRLWNRSEEMTFDWAASDPWTHRIQLG